MTGSARERLLALQAAGELDLPFPASGRTAERHRRLADLTRTETVSVGRLAEAHTDAVAILAEAGLTPAAGALYGVWASDHGPQNALRLDEREGAVTGVKRFCSGIGVVDRALVIAADRGDEPQLVEVALDHAGVETSTTSWATHALADTATGDVSFRGHRVERLVGTRSWYTDRPGFWDGACGPAACWAGGALGLVDAIDAAAGVDPVRDVDIGAMVAAGWAMLAALDAVGHDIDAAPVCREQRRARALAARHTVERQVAIVVDRFGWAAGPRPMCFDGEIAQRLTDVQLYVRQHGGARDLRALAGDHVRLLGPACDGAR